ncbi:MAG TPA: hypothetical protein VL137_10255 [Polyangiaceae bacterium]|jgi:hypothetical protein|nr:hypothetical protein [Polyangiaceae bacterium]
MLYAFLLLLGLLGLATYLLVIFREVPGAVDERLGQFEALPSDVGQWRSDETSDAGRAALAQGERREVRLWQHHSGGFFSSEQLCEQVRYRDVSTGQILRSEPDRPIKRKRRRTPSS